MMKIVLVLIIVFIAYRISEQIKVEKIKSRWLKGETSLDKFDEDDFSKWRQKKEAHKKLRRDPLFWIVVSIILAILLCLFIPGFWIIIVILLSVILTLFIII
jgi:Mg2+/citrate symporter